MPLIAAAVVLGVLNPITIPVGLVLLAHAWAIPELYAARGAKALRQSAASDPNAERVALGLLGDLLGPDARELCTRTRLGVESGSLGTWILGPGGAVLARPGGRRVHCYCVKVAEAGLPASDQIAHLLLALREDEVGFATVANLVFSGASWRLRRRLPSPAREVLAAAVETARRPVDS